MKKAAAFFLLALVPLSAFAQPKKPAPKESLWAKVTLHVTWDKRRESTGETRKGTFNVSMNGMLKPNRDFSGKVGQGRFSPLLGYTLENPTFNYSYQEDWAVERGDERAGAVVGQVKGITAVGRLPIIIADREQSQEALLVERPGDDEDGLLLARAEAEDGQTRDVLGHVDLQPAGEIPALDLEPAALIQILVELGGDEPFHVQVGDPTGAVGNEGNGDGPGPGRQSQDYDSPAWATTSHVAILNILDFFTMGSFDL